MAPKRKAHAAKKAPKKKTKKTKAEQAAAASPTVEPEPAQPSRSPQTSKVLRCAPHTSRTPCTQAACQHARLHLHPLPSRRPHSALALTDTRL